MESVNTDEPSLRSPPYYFHTSWPCFWAVAVGHTEAIEHNDCRAAGHEEQSPEQHLKGGPEGGEEGQGSRVLMCD